MKILLIQPMSYLLSLSGAAKANRMLVEEISKQGHECRVICLEKTMKEGYGRNHVLALLNKKGIFSIQTKGKADVYQHNNVEVHAISDDIDYGIDYCSHMMEQISEFTPDWILLSEDRPYVPLSIALESNANRVIFICHSQVFLPFGPESFSKNEDKQKVALLSQAAGIISVSTYIHDYLYKWGKLESTVIRFPVYGKGPFPRFGNFDNGYILMINPSPIKGIGIFCEIARAFPHLQFAAVPSWATTYSDKVLLESIPNIILLEPVKNIQEILSKARVVIVPSLWGEGFGQIVVESMLCGIPVIASDAGALPEAKLGVDYLIHVNAISEYGSHIDGIGLPQAIIPQQDIDPWKQALSELLTSHERYDEVAEASRTAAINFVEGINPGAIIDFLFELGESIKKKDENISVRLSRTLSIKQRQKLLEQLKNQKSGTSQEVVKSEDIIC